MKHTKKRALLSAVAMLIVSAVVLSGATFAWFTAGNQANITGISASVGTSSSLQVSPDNGTSWFSNLVQSDFPAASDATHFTSQLTAISFDPATGLWWNGAFAQSSQNFTSTSAADTLAGLGGKVVKFTFLIRSTSKVTVSYNGSTLSGTANNAVYSLMKIGAAADNAADATPIILKNGADAYYPINAAGNAKDSNGNYIIDTADTPKDDIISSNAASVVLFGNVANTFTLDAGQVKQIIVYMWLEGQDANCFIGSGGVSDSASIALNFIATPRA